MNTKLTNILLILLLIFNVAFVGKWWMGHRKFHQPKKQTERVETTTLLHDPDKAEIYLVKSLGLDSIQQKKLDTILIAHFKFQDRSMSDYIREQTMLFNSLKNRMDSVAFKCSDSLGVLKVAMERELYLHFIHIRSICNGDQQAKFDELIDNMSKEFVHHHDFHSSAKAGHDSL
ncbi:MAG TPA: hypothetical protein VK808_08320 [Bacteroidia bacterium]|jgi:hypothetical protein|nr:hypothetical protein [Bacteroidia bacterium]